MSDKLKTVLTVAVPAAVFAVILTLLACHGCHREGAIPTPPTHVPSPGPIPDPPTPAPSAEVGGFVLFEETEKASGSRGQLLADPKVAAYIAEHHLRHRVVDLSSIKAQPGGPPPELVKYVALAEGKPLPYLFLLDRAGAAITGKDKPAPLEADAFLAAIGAVDPKASNELTEVVVDGHPRKLGNKIPPVRGPPKFAKLYGSTPDTPVIPRDQWKEIDLGAYLPPVHDQDGRGQCNASASCTMLEAARNIAGLPYAYLSAGDNYSFINGGRDDGSLLEDGMENLLKRGVAPVSKVAYVWDGRKHDSAELQKEREKYKLTEVYLCPTFDHYASALQSGFVGTHGILWYDNFNPSSKGWLPLKGSGGYGGHALCGYGLAKANTTSGKTVWGVRTRNSWGDRWGVGGNCIIPETLFSGPVGGWYVTRAVRQVDGDWPPVSKRNPLRLLGDPTEVAVAW